MTIVTVTCEDGRQRGGPFRSHREAGQFAEWGHCCLAKHTYATLAWPEVVDIATWDVVAGSYEITDEDDPKRTYFVPGAPTPPSAGNVAVLMVALCFPLGTVNPWRLTGALAVAHDPAEAA